ncbi:hypothetical protein FQN57_003652 [Myotisia sp. PD_48]|nr:hypothetical protein FQN57_003652 [Myotisia sp. PD_48]
MAHSFFAPKSASSASRPTNPTSSPLSSPPPPQHTNSNGKMGPLDLRSPFLPGLQPVHGNKITLRPSISKSHPSHVKNNDESAQFDPYPHPVPSSSTPHPHVTIDQIKTAHVPSLMRITGLLLPIKYQNSFYTATITDPVIASVSRVAIYRNHPPMNETGAVSSPPSIEGTDKVIGGIRCRLEVDVVTFPKSRPSVNLYIQALHLLSPYRGKGIAASLLDSILYAKDTSSTPNIKPSKDESSSRRAPSDLVKHYNIQTVTAHVHEINDEALSWYLARGFVIQDGVVEQYYRRLNPGGAKIVKLTLGHAANRGHEDMTRSYRADNDDNDDGWEKVELHECDNHENIDDYQKVERGGASDIFDVSHENPSKRARRT